ncbi:MAG: aminotransferase class I/II-fold pyridoxal phosphate-dependent enzyme [Archangium sp.]|nr:aminotransferase class I/II-fold pyridoxal phosphate-dependent enzyme [Archangium sp.]
MQLEPFQLERFFAQHEFSARYLLSSSDCDGLPMSELLALASPAQRAAWDALTLGYTESAGLPQLREAIARHYPTATPADVLVLSPGEANFIAMNVLLSAGDHVVCMRPAYQSLSEVPRALGCDVSFWGPHIVDGRWSFDPEELAALLTPRTKLVVLNFPHNPTGFIPSSDEYRAILQIVERHGAWLFSDEMYRGLASHPSLHLQAACDLTPRALSLWGMAKSFGLAGTRIGWLVVKDANVRERIQRFRDYLTICNSAPSELLALIALDHSEALIARNQATIDTNRAHFAAFCRAHASVFTDLAAEGGSTTFTAVKVPGTTLGFSEALVRDTGVMSVPSEMFGYVSGFLRVGLGRKNLPQTLDVLADHLAR